jgi:aerobic carbon-monoxide dehydrogenase medium subunit
VHNRRRGGGFLKAPSFAYAKAKSLSEAFELVERPGAKILAGGQSLIASLNMRLASPELLVDITGLRDLTGIEVRPAGLRVGALVTHAELEKSELVAQHAPLLAQAAAQVAHPAIRNRGTLGGSLALADPAAEYPACALALNATLVLLGRRGERRVSAAHFFKGLFETDLRPGEILAAAEFPRVERSVFLELARRQGDYAIVGLAGVADASGRRIAFCGVGPTPVLAARAARETSLEAAKAALAKDLNPPADLYHSPATKLHLAGVLLARAWNTLARPH